GFSYDNWGGHNQLVRLNQQNPEVCGYICDVIRFWVAEFDIDGLRLDTADVLDFGFMQNLRRLANDVKPEFWLMGEVIHGEYIRWVNDGMLHAVTDYSLHKALYSGHNDHNYFEIAHTVKRIYNDMGLNRPGRPKLYSFVDNHDVERIVNKLNDRRQLTPVYILLFTLPGIPSIYYGSEFAVEGKKENGSDDSLRPALTLEDYTGASGGNALEKLIAKLGAFRQSSAALCFGEYRECLLTNRQFAFARSHEGETVIIAVNNDENPAELYIPAENGTYTGVLTGETAEAENGKLRCVIPGCGGEIWTKQK
ncbi:MAG: alpha-glucosidase C-terminal domain-containing protein, partial [Eubacterium sp.]|nr:alpha-glucosidase C-terminal domain-containing protein [Eubacterium sp.]